MSVTIKGNKRTKREMVIPFEGEEMFVVPKRKGFGQPDMDKYVMAVGSQTGRTPTTTTTPTNLPNDGSTNTTSGTNIPIGTPSEPIPTGTSTTNTNPSPAEPLPNEIPTPPVATPQQLCVSNGGLWVNGACQTSSAPEPLPAETTCINSGGAWINGACVTSTNPKVVALTTTTGTNTPIVDELPTFPVWSSLDCVTLKDKIAEYNAILSTSRFAQNIIDAYNTAIATAQGIYNGKCNVTPPTPITPITPIVEIGGGGGGGFGGGGGGSAPEEPQPQEEVAPDESGKRIGIILVLALIGGLYFLTRKSN
jgi:hypothetical protein